jgi:Na+-translocating ferredoxin:NAD+ oxidoreductase RnfC subunit
LYYNSPFHERLVSVNILNKKGKFEGDTKYFNIKNGTNLGNFLQYFKNKYKYFTINSLYNKQPALEIGEDFIFNIYNHSSFYICETKNSSVTEGICIDCGDCNYYCPVNANPKSLLNININDFKKDLCVNCGICTVFCPANIDFQFRIEKERGN